MVDLTMITGWRDGKEVIVAEVEGLSWNLPSGAQEKHE